MIKVKHYLLAFVLMLLTASTFYSQGKLIGTVKDSLDSSELIAANIMLQGTSMGGATDIDGKFRITGIPEGDYVVRFSYVGYITKRIPVKILNGKALKLDIELKPDIFESDEVVVSAQAAGQVAAINQQLSSNTIVNVVSEEKIQELPDANAAEAIGRLPGVSLSRSGGEANKIILRGLSGTYTYVTVDGVKIPSTDAESRGVDLSTLSQNNLAGIELYKALTADKEADGIAGSVNLVTKSAPEGRNFRLVTRGGYNDLMNSAEQYNISFKYSERYFDNIVGLQASGNFERAIRSSERYNLSWDVNQGPDQRDYYINELEVRFSDEVRKRNGGNIILDFRTPDDGTIKFNNSYSMTNRDYITYQRNYNIIGGDSQVGGVTYSYRDREKEIGTYSSALTGNNNLFDFNINWGLSFAESKAEYPYDYQMDFAEPQSLGSSGMKAGAPELKADPERLVQYAYNNFTASSLSEAWYRSQDNTETDMSTYLDLKTTLNFGDLISNEIKFGGRYRSKSRKNNNSEVYSPYYLGNWKAYTVTDNGIKAKNFAGTGFEDFYNNYLETSSPHVSFVHFLDGNPESRDLYDKYTMYPLINRDRLQEWYDLNKNGVNQSGSTKEYPVNPAAEARNYDITESVASAYLMNTTNIGNKLTVITGLRMEYEFNDYNNKWSPDQIGGFPIPQGVAYDTTGSYNETVWLPNLQINYKATDWLNVRIAAYRALARPDFNMRLNSYFAWDPASSSGNSQLLIGNTKLKTAKAWNFEINTSFYGNEIGLISVSAFYKQIDDMYHMLSSYPTSGSALLESLDLDWDVTYNGNYEMTVPYNSPDPSKVWGFEFEHQINFTWAPSIFKNFVLSYNFSLIKSESTLISSATDTTYTQVEVLPGYWIPVPEYSNYRTSRTQPLENQPEFFGNLSLGYDYAGFSGRISLFHQGEYYTSYSASGRSDRVISAYTRLDLSMKYQLLDNLALLFNANNLNNISEDNIQKNKVYNYDILRRSETYGTTMDFGVRFDL